MSCLFIGFGIQIADQKKIIVKKEKPFLVYPVRNRTMNSPNERYRFSFWQKGMGMNTMITSRQTWYL